MEKMCFNLACFTPTLLFSDFSLQYDPAVLFCPRMHIMWQSEHLC